MLSAYSVLMMLLILTGSLIGISSIYTPANVETQPQPQPQKPMIGSKIIVEPKPLTAQMVLEAKRLQIQLVDKLMPEIIKRIKVDLKVTDSYSPPTRVAKQGLPTSTFHATEAKCPPGTRVMGGGGQISTKYRAPPSGLFDFNAKDVPDNNIAALMIIPTSRLGMVAKMETPGSLMAYATCLAPDAVVSLKEVSGAVGLGADPYSYLTQDYSKLPSQPQPLK
jgi:hypothetical protein